MAENNLREIAFPTLSEQQVAELAHCSGAKLERHADGEVLYDVGDRASRFFVIAAGGVEIVERTDGQTRTIVSLGPGQFTGEVAHLTGSPALATALARGDCQVYPVTAEALRQVIERCPETGETVLQAFLARRHLLRESDQFAGLRVIGSRFSQNTFRIRDFVARNRVPFAWLDLESDPAVAKLLQHFGVDRSETPVVVSGDRLLLRNPSNRELAEALGIRKPIEKAVYDLVVVGGGPAGLAAAVYGASEGLSTVVIERIATGGQAGRSMRIENYLGFPAGISGSDLAERATIQAERFGAKLSIASQAIDLRFDGIYAVLQIDSGESLVSKCCLIATGAEYRQLGVEGCERLEGRGVYYAATPNEAAACKGADVVVVGGGNSAGQAVAYLARHARRVHLVIRGDDLHANMSSYLAHRLEQTENVEILLETEVKEIRGEEQLREVVLVNRRTGEQRVLKAVALFSFIGAVPRTDWLPDAVETDDKGFVVTGPAAAGSRRWSERRQPYLLETTRAGTFAAGDVRASSVKRVASAVGEGSMAVQFVHHYLSER